MKKRLSCLLFALLFIFTAAPFALALGNEYPNDDLFLEPYDFHELLDAESLGYDLEIEALNLNLPTTRERAAVFLVMGRNPNLLTNGAIPTGSRFNDVPQSRWSFPAVTWAAEHSWVAGTGGNNFSPDRNVTREEYAVMLVRAFSTALHSGTLDFTDANQIASWAVPYVRRAVANGWILGFPDGMRTAFRPRETITREHAIMMTQRAMNSTPGTPHTISDPIARTITWNGNGVTSPAQWQRIQNQALGPLPTLSRANHVFAGWWNTSAAGGGAQTWASTRTPSANTTYWARWHPNVVVPTIGQEFSNWCFAASGVAALQNRGNTVTQTAFAQVARGNTQNLPATRDETLRGLRNWSGGRTAWGSGGVTSAAISSELAAGRPVLAGVSGHMMVVSGFNTTTNHYIVMDPWPVGRGEVRNVLATNWVAGSNWTTTIRF